jgi:hypothetical protein
MSQLSPQFPEVSSPRIVAHGHTVGVAYTYRAYRPVVPFSGFGSSRNSGRAAMRLKIPAGHTRLAAGIMPKNSRKRRRPNENGTDAFPRENTP